MLSVISILSFHMVDLSLSIRFEFQDLGGMEPLPPWQWGDVRWVPVSPTFPKNHFPNLHFTEFEGDNNCAAKMKPMTNWRAEEHQFTILGGVFYNVPRYYIRNRRASDNVRNHYIASRNPIIRGLDDVRGDPEPIDENTDPDRFMDFGGIVQIADVFCHDSTMEKVRLGTKSKLKQVEECGVIETLVSLCMSDTKITPGRNENKPLIAETFARGPALMDVELREESRLLAENHCAKFFRIEALSKNGVGAITNKEQWSRKWGRYLKGAWIAGYKRALVLDARLNDQGNLSWKAYNIDTLLTGIFMLENDEVYAITPMAYENGKAYWYFCCESTETRC